MKVLVFGASGMIGSAMVRVLSETKEWQVFGTLRSDASKRFFSPSIASRLLTNIDVDSQDALVRVFAQVKPDVVINCIGLTKHHIEASDPLLAIPVNALLPHRMAALCAVVGARLVHVSTDCIFSGAKGSYVEEDAADASDLYGKSKFLGEVNYPHAITLRTSTIGHELETTYGLLEWFLSQEGSCKGFNQAIFSGLPNTVFAQIVRDIVIPRADLSGLYHVGTAPIGKYDLLRLIADIYGKSIDVIRDDGFVIDRSLDSTRFYKATGYDVPSWPTLVQSMYMSRQREIN
ncbi:MAG: SDR family oxidoreductase [Cytophaga sp.]|nr:SDR family oxidoreductase [Undibacterium sp.]